MILSVDDFEAFHLSVHGVSPFRWQTRLLEEIVRNRTWPAVLDLPTGSGKTTCLDIAVFALALDTQDPANRWCPRRIAMVVDRRVVVDQVAERGRKLLAKLISDDSPPVTKEVAKCLRSISRRPSRGEGQGDPIGVFTLRGGIPKDDGWARTPDRPLILASTVDQIGSRLFLQGYGVTTAMRPVHAGLLGNDLLLLLDEVHLSRPFAETLDQLAHLRSRFRESSNLPERFVHVFLSATPGNTNVPPFRLSEDETNSASALEKRLRAAKPAVLEVVDDRLSLERSCVDRSRDLLQRHTAVAVIVNRVTSAMTIATQLREGLRDTADVAVLTGRMRPLDRDDVMGALRSRIESGRDRRLKDRKLVVVATQCLEAGADFDFDALVTEAASLDALRQRFGRLDRLGDYDGKAEAFILHAKSEKDDPIYGTSIARTFAWLKERRGKKSKTVDFGVLALPPASEEEAEALQSPRKHAPVLLPAYLDLWTQTSPAPALIPDLSLWLHGPDSGPADVQIVWRADLDEADLAMTASEDADDSGQAHPADIVAAIHPSSLEAVSVPFATAWHWLDGSRGNDSDSDLEGIGKLENEAQGGRLALRWNGTQSQVIDARGLRPGDTIVVPSGYGGVREYCFDPTDTNEVVDLAERGALFSRGQPCLRLSPKVLAQFRLRVSGEDDREDRLALAEAASDAERPGWQRIWLGALARAKGSFPVIVGDKRWKVLTGRRLSAQTLRGIARVGDTLEDGADSTTDDEDSPFVGSAVPLSQHSADVEEWARTFAINAGLPNALVEDLALAGWVHDIGKADRRFQLLLRGGSEIELFKDETPWAKSRMLAGNRGLQRLARRRSGYPEGARHEVQSVAMLERHIAVIREKASDVDLVLHLVASHHGFCRPFAPAVEDPGIDVVLSDHTSRTFGRINFDATSSRNELHRLDSPLADRFWSLVERYGWHGLCWLEAILRLADHRASEAEQEEEGSQ